MNYMKLMIEKQMRILKISIVFKKFFVFCFEKNSIIRTIDFVVNNFPIDLHILKIKKTKIEIIIHSW